MWSVSEMRIIHIHFIFETMETVWLSGIFAMLFSLSSLDNVCWGFYSTLFSRNEDHVLTCACEGIKPSWNTMSLLTFLFNSATFSLNWEFNTWITVWTTVITSKYGNQRRAICCESQVRTKILLFTIKHLC